MTDVKSEALRYLGCRGREPDAVTAELLEKGYKELSAAAVTRSCWKLADKSEVAGLLIGDDIERHLAGCDRVVFFAATLGSAADGLIRRAEIGNMAYALILDALASAMTEEYCDSTELEIKQRVGGYFTWRFSPGYGDYPISVQPELIQYLNAGKLIGLTVTDSDILLPRKSVTAVIGVSGDELDKGVRGCATCGMRDKCQFRKDGMTCGNS